MTGNPLSFEKRKNSKLLRRESFSGELDISAKKEIDELATLLEMARVSTLAICVCNPPVLRMRIMDVLKKKVSDSNVKVYDVTTTEKDEHLVKILAEIERSRKFKRYEKKHRNVAFSIRGIENIFRAKDSLKISRFYQNLNLYRDYFVQSKHPVLLWVNDTIASDMTTRAPDFWRARTKVAIFRPREEIIAKSVMQISKLPIYYRDLADVKRRDRVYERLMQSLDPSRPQDKTPYLTLSLSLGLLKEVQGLYDKAESLYKKSLEMATEANDRRLMSRCLQYLGSVRNLRADYNTAKELYRQSLKIDREFGDKEGIGTNLNQLGAIEYSRGNYDKAEELYRQSLKIAKELGNKEGISSNLNQLGMIEYSRGNYDKAEELHRQSLKIAKELGNKEGISSSFHQLGMIEYSRGNYDKAEELHRQSLKIAKELGNKKGISSSSHQLGIIESARGNYDKAEELYRQGLKIDRELGDKKGVGASLHQLANTEFIRGNYDKAEELYRQSLKILKELGNKEKIAAGMGSLGILLVEVGRPEDAFESFIQAAYLYHKLDSSREQQALKDIAVVAEKLGSGKVEEILERVPEEVKNYLKQMQEIKEKQSRAS